jgi:hypothetical protein
VKGILTGKFFEYLGAKRPILAIGAKDSDLAGAVNETQCGFLADFEDVEGTTAFLKDAFQKYLDGNLYSSPINTGQFSSQELANRFCQLV